ncbi:MAG: hypothetical protein AAF478_09380 [Pseudomonadota bacterium]
MNKLVISVGLVFLFSSGQAFAAMSKAEIEDKIIGKSFKFQTTSGAAGKVKHSRNGKSRLSNTNFELKRDSGTWRFKGNRHCISWKIIRDGKEKCFSYTDNGDGTYRTHDGTKLFR